jgi:dihydroorotate dehydrogenase
MSLAYRLIRRGLFALDPERAHELALQAIRHRLIPRRRAGTDARLKRTLLGLDFPNPVGLAAGFDKNGEAIDGLFDLGFGFVEVGTVTPQPQSGNPRPRLFRLPANHALINRMGFNNQGFDALHRRLLERKDKTGIVGVNIGANRDSVDRVADYVAGVERFADLADYLAVNVSSPNTPGLRDLQQERALAGLLERLVKIRDASTKRPPLLLKIAPDLDDAELAAIVDTALTAGIEGMIISNTTTTRIRVKDPVAQEAGGLSGYPLMRLSNIAIAKVRKRAGRRLVLIGVGSVLSPELGYIKLAAGADLLQLYTGLIYEGPGLPARILAELPQLLERTGFASICELVGSDTDRWVKARI